MALVSYQGFDGLNNSTDLLAGPFNSFTYSNETGGNSDNPLVSIVVTSTNARGGVGNCVTFNTAGTGTGASFHNRAIKGFNSTISSAIMGVAVIFPSSAISGNIYPTLGFANAGTVQLTVRMDNTGTVTVWRGRPNAANGTLLATSSTTLSPTSYNYLELQATIGSGTSGSFTVRANGVIMTGLNVSGVNTSGDGTANLTQAFIGPYTQSGGMTSGINFCYYDDMVMLDTTGVSPYNAFLGDCRVQTVYPVASGALVQWTPLASTNVSQVQETAMDGDTSYNASGTNGQIDLFTQGGISNAPLNIFAVKVRLACRLDSAGGDTVAGEVRSGGANYAATAQAALSTYSYLDFIWTTDPATSAAWTKTGVNALQIGYNRVS